MTPDRRELEVLKPNEVARILKVSRGTVYRWMHNGTLPYVKIGGDTYRIPADEVRKLIRPLGDTDAN